MKPRLSNNRLFDPIRVPSVLLLATLLSLPARAQQDSLSDVFPLAVGNTWVYDFTGSDTSPMAHRSWHDTGTTVANIVSVLRYQDVAYWNVKVRSDFRRTTHGGGSFSSQIAESSYVTVAESLTGTHVLSVGGAWIRRSLYPFTPCFSPPLSRYSAVDPHGVLEFRRSDWSCAYPAQVLLQKNVGVTSNSTTDGLYNTARFTLLRCILYPYVQFVHPDRVVLSTVAGESTDTTVFLSNAGLDTLRILEVTSSDPELIVTAAGNAIPPSGHASLRLWFSSRRIGERNASIAIRSNASTSPDTIQVQLAALSSKTGLPYPDPFALGENYPNPFNGSTTIRIDIPEPCELTFTVTDVLGRTVKAATEPVPAGTHWKVVDANGLSSGVYLYSVRAGRYAGARKMLLIR